VLKAGLDTLITGEADYPTEVTARELGINLILGGHRETEVFGARELAARIRVQTWSFGRKGSSAYSVTRSKIEELISGRG